MKLDRKEFDVLVAPSGGGGGGGPAGTPPAGVQTLGGKGKGEEGEGDSKTYSEPEDGGDKEKEGKGKGSGKSTGKAGETETGDGSGEGDKKEGKEGKGKSTAGKDKPGSEVDVKISKPGIGGILTREQAEQIAKDVGATPPPDWSSLAKEMEREARDNMDKIDRHPAGQKQAGTGRGSLLKRKIAELTQPKVDWKAALKRFIGQAMSNMETYFGSRRHLYKDEYFYGDKVKFDALTNAIVAVDLSGSMSDSDRLAVLSEIAGIVKAKKIKETEVVYFDDGILGKDTIKNLAVAAALAPPGGGGGTSFKPPLDYMFNQWKKGKMQLGVFMTDGMSFDDYGKYPKDFAKGFVWLIIDMPDFQPPFGAMVVHISKKDLKGE